jgi:hypothetical protein
MLLLLTNSLDGTADVLVGLCAERGQSVFRFNIDLWARYRFAWMPDGFAFADPSGRAAASEAITACLWRRPSLREAAGWVGGDPEAREATEAELHALMREIAEWARARGLLRLIEPNGPRRVGRLAQMRVAREFFAVPDWSVGWGVRLPAGRRMVKRLTTEPLGPERDRQIYVQSVEAERLAPDWPWLTQAIAQGSRDATALYVAGRLFAFEMAQSRAELGVEDWRTRVGAHADAWRPWATPPGFAERVEAYMRRLGLRYGRLDFLSGGGEPTFLEVNPNGQFGWLDDPAGWPLHRAVLDAALDAASTLEDEPIRETSEPPPEAPSASTGG